MNTPGKNRAPSHWHSTRASTSVFDALRPALGMT